jgi:ABC-2 type transport system permease protein
MTGLTQSFIRASSFFRKEIVEVIRQPRLILTLVLGPFLILFLFGIGYRNEPRAVRTLFVADPESQLAQQVQEYAPKISPQLVFVGIVEDESAALRSLAQGEIDLVVVTPSQAYEMIRNNQQAEFSFYHNEIDPAQIGYIEYLGQTLVNEVNRLVLSSIAQQGQYEATDVRRDTQAAKENAAAMKQALLAGDAVRARAQQAQMRQNINAVSLAVGASAGLLSGVQQNTGTGANTSPEQDMLAILASLQNNPNGSLEIQEGKSDYIREIAEIEEVEQKLAELEEKLAEFQSISPDILVRPFRATTRNLSQLQFTPSEFFTPGVIVLLLQHIAVTTASLSIVRERRSGAIELFRVSPISSMETLLGKYASYLIFGAIIAGILVLLLAYGLRMPMLGNWVNFSGVLLAVLFASLGVGFVISLIADTESHAVQLAMIMLLLSVFFTGFMLDLRYLWEPIRVVSWSLPATYGASLLQNIMLRGRGMDWFIFGGLIGIGLLLFLVSWLLLRRRMSHE